MVRHELSIYCRFHNEAIWLREWLEIHLLLGVDHFYLCDHLSTDHPRGVLEPYMARGLVTLFEWTTPLPTVGDHSQVFKDMGNHFLRTYGHETKWAMILDADEVMVPSSGATIKQILKNYEAYGGVVVNWQCFGTSRVENLSTTGKTMIESLITRAPRAYAMNRHVKTILQPARTARLEIHHARYLPGYYAVNTDRRRVDGPFNEPVLVDKLRIHHYFLRDRKWMTTVKRARRLAFGHDANVLERWDDDMSTDIDLRMMEYVPLLRSRVIPPLYDEYLKSRPDLQEAGIVSPEAVRLHWFNHGRWE